MKRRMWFMMVAAAVFVSCEREFLVPPQDEEIDGYEIRGTVRDRLGNPLRNIPIRIFYDFVLVENSPPPPTEFEVTNSAQVIRVAVFDRLNRQRLVLYNGTHPLGTMDIRWNKKDVNGRDMPSGVYTVHYIIDGQTRKSYPVTVTGTVSARTDSSGAFRIGDEFLPVGFFPVPLYNSDSTRYFGLHRITEGVGLQFLFDERPPRNVFVTLFKGVPSRVELSVN